MKSEVDVLPYKPKLFDPRIIATEEYKPYIYAIKFSGKEVKDISAEGYIHAISPYLEKLKTELVKLEYVPRTEKTSGYFYAVVKVTLHLKFKTDANSIAGIPIEIDGFGDGDSKEAKDPAALIRIVETRAIKRAVARALDLGKKDINLILNKSEEEINEEETGTPISKEYNPGAGSPTGHEKLTNAIKASQDRVRKVREEKKSEESGEQSSDEPDW